MPWSLIVVLFILYVLIGLMLTVPAPPYWVWIPAMLGTLMLVVGLTRPLASNKLPNQSPSRSRNQPLTVPSERSGLAAFLAYLGGLLLVVPLAVAANYAGSEQSFGNIRFVAALVSLALLTLLAVLLTAAVAVISTRAGASLLRIFDDRRSLSVLLLTCFAGAFLGGLAGFLTLTLPAGN